MHHQKDTHTEAAIYWSAVSLIVCEGLSVGAAAERLGIENGRLRNILRRRLGGSIGLRSDGERRRERENRDHQKESAAAWHSVLPVARRLCQCSRSAAGSISRSCTSMEVGL